MSSEETLIHLASLSDDGAIGTERFPDSQTEADLVEEVLAREFNGLSMVEQDQVLFDIHGIPQLDDDDPEDVESCISDLEKELGKIRTKTAFEEARYLNAGYVNSRQFRLLFLRCERFDARKAAKKMVTHFEAKKSLFGSGEVLARGITLSDMTADDTDALEAGFMQILPTRDAAGRSVFVIVPGQKKEKSVANAMRAMWYLFATALHDEECQKKGVVIVVYAIGSSMVESFETLKRAHSVREGIPKKVVGVHVCYDNLSMRPLVAGVKLFMNRDMRARVRPHRGSHDEVVFELQTYGIPINNQHFSSDGSFSSASHREWLQVRKSQEETPLSASDVITVPRRFDVLFGRGKNTREHTGNLRCVHLVEMNRQKYELASKHEKTAIAERIVSIVYESYGRFLKWDTLVG